MKQIHLSIDRFWLFILYALALFPILPKAVESILMMLFFMTSMIIFFKTKEKGVSRKEILKTFLFSSVFLLYFISSFYSENKSESIEFMTRTAPILMFPLSIGILAKRKINTIDITIILKLYLTSLIVALMSSQLYLHFFMNISSMSDWEYRQAFEKLTDIHGTYLSLWISLGVFIVLVRIVKTIKTARTITLLLLAFSFGYLMYWQIAIGARLPFITTIFLIIGYLIFKINSRFFRALIITGIVSVITVLIVFNQNLLVEKVNFSLPKGDYSIEHKAMTSEQIRSGIYYCSFGLISESWLFGYGIGDVNDELQECYKEKIDSNVYQRFHYNAHNQYVQMVLSSGLIGLIFFILSLLLAMHIAIKDHNHLYIMFTILLLTCFLTENILSRHDGVLFYSFFNSIFAFYKRKSI